ncbi:endonuclease/exonuclease/phosphatase family protein [Streptomyces sp. NBC_00841]|uniref:endonuclease/exonuclease/phosphatase family protein n=1 Tax=unclassified Streptomyces TaxID=2593676 RepID=UPI0022515577|nr:MULTISPECIES: endonuclease/exonuclease/phosphatase family protein [unclassified Streptomyces]MCX4534102.1 endonuclease/exonuclease/phosphatase family protein [Streptomyces sp. NBC_01669]WSA00528.1 endonuclease/exonuclease/phosphatase family protein [Streptomyces sp. NBC_00841]
MNSTEPACTGTRRRPALWVAALTLVVASVVVGFRAVGTDGMTPVPQALAFLPWLLVPGGVGLGLAALARWRTGMVWAAVVLALTVWFLRPYGPGSTGAHGPVLARLSVLTSNVEFGGATDALITAVRRARPDIVFVEECDFRCADALAARVPHTAYPYRNVVRLDGSLGSAILSRHPLRPTGGIDGAMAMPGSVAVVAGKDVRLQLAHPMPPIPGMVGKWRTELGRVRDFAAGSKGSRTIVAGDFNASQDHAAFRAVLDAGGLHDSARIAGASRTYSWPADRSSPLRTQIDHVLVSDDFSVRSARFLRLDGTDHRALLVGLDLHAG